MARGTQEARRLQKPFCRAWLATPMRILVTGAANPVGTAVAKALVKAGHVVRAFGIPAGEDPFHGAAGIECFAGDVAVSGSLEPVAAECQALVHCANLDAAAKSSNANSIHIEAGTRYARYAAERELVLSFVALFPARPRRVDGTAIEQAKAHVTRTRPTVPHHLLTVSAPEDAVAQVLAAVARLPVVA